MKTPFTRQSWENAYVRWVIGYDASAITAVCAAGVLLGARAANLVLMITIGLMVATALLATTQLVGARDPAILGGGGAEYRRLVRGFAVGATAVGMVGLAIRLDHIRPWVFGVVPAACVVALAGRLALRKALHRRRLAGACGHHVLAVGGVDAVADLIARTRRDLRRGWTITAACTPTGTGSILGVPVVGDLDAVAAIARRGLHRIVSVGLAPGWSSARLHKLAWDLEEIGAELLVDPRLTEVAGPRLCAEPVDGLPLLHLTRPTLDGTNRLVKATVDRVVATLLLILLAPLMLALVVAVRSGGGPAWHRETRIGRDGSPFTLLRFRSIVADPESRDSAVGSWMRRYALDELPQLFNVLAGSMSLVGPRPALPEEMLSSAVQARRTFPIKPGLTGLWQVSGQRHLSWEEEARLDLRYVQHWSLIQDAVIAWTALTTATRPTNN